MKEDLTILEVRNARAEIWQECGEDWDTLLVYYQSLQEQNEDVLVRKQHSFEEHSVANILLV
jgi:hypothetical protein